jgi:anion-transporting  ArsA/GET3 family ATPase
VKPINALITQKKIIVCCGAGGVGKTTTAASLSLAAARAGRRVLVLTIDPSRRLAETLGVSRNPPKPVSVPLERQQLAGISPPACLDAWMLDSKLIADEAVRRLTKTPEDAERVLSNRIYQQVSSMVAGMHEYTAMEALYRLVHEGRYDLVVLDTPPSRHALDFLEAPRRLSRLVDSKALHAFLPKADGLVGRAASRVLQAVLTAVFGEDFARDFVGFLSTFTSIFQSLNVDVNDMRTFLSSPEVAFLLVTSPAAATLAEADFFFQKTKELGLPFRAFVLNRSHAYDSGWRFPEANDFADVPIELKPALSKLQALATEERAASDKDAALLAQLKQQAGEQATAVALPNLPQGADDMGTLVTIADALAAQ